MTNKYVVRATLKNGTHQWFGYDNGERRLFKDLWDPRVSMAETKEESDFSHPRVQETFGSVLDKVETCVVGMSAYPV